jgi:hypothetical protein
MLTMIGLVAVMYTASAVAGETVIAVSADGVRPDSVSVRSGDRVRWRGPANARLELDVEDHAGQHLVAARHNDVAVTFLDAGRHRFAVRIGDRDWLRGVVDVSPGTAPNILECGLESTRTLCVEP